MSRIQCSHCRYPIKTCVCSAISQINCDTKIIILQHPSETSHAKNTARLVTLAIPSADIMVGEKPEDFLSLSEQCETQQSMAVFYPSPTSADFELATNPQPIETLLFLDGTWRKALKLWLLNPWLWAIPTYRINPLKPSNYDIRKTKQPNSLSTLEAVSYGLKLNETVDTAPLLALQSAMQRHWGSSHLRSKPTPLAPTAAAKK